jgi:cardiolipin hydrolase
MHHKFVIVDKKVLITGSFNWTVQAVKSNNENVLMIQNEQLVKEYVKEFDELWKGFKEEITPEEAKEETKKK